MLITNRMPQVGDVIKQFNGYCPLLVKRVYERDEGGIGFICVPYNPNNDPHYGKDDLYYHSYELVNGMIRSIYACSPGTTGYSMRDGGINGDGYDYIEIIQAAAQGSLF
jgi:hypothetical protein